MKITQISMDYYYSSVSREGVGMMSGRWCQRVNDAGSNATVGPLVMHCLVLGPFEVTWEKWVWCLGVPGASFSMFFLVLLIPVCPCI